MIFESNSEYRRSSNDDVGNPWLEAFLVTFYIFRGFDKFHPNGDFDWAPTQQVEKAETRVNAETTPNGRPNIVHNATKNRQNPHLQVFITKSDIDR